MPATRLRKAYDGTWVRSQWEATVLLENSKRRAQIQYEPERIPYQVVEDRYYTPDLILPGGMWVELKGWFRPEDRRKMRQIRRCYPHQAIGILFQGKVTAPIKKGSPTTLEDWCTRFHFLCAQGPTIPPLWYTLGGEGGPTL